MKLKPDELEANGYVQEERLVHDELIPFVRKYIKKKTRISFFQSAVHVLIIMAIAFFFWKNYQSESFNFGKGLLYLYAGASMIIVLIPLHELVHGLAYKAFGAPNVSYDMKLKKFQFLAVADQFVANKKEFRIVAIAPFLVITLAICLPLLFLNSLWTLSLLGALLTHTACCTGDFALLSYVEYHKDKEMVTYDDKANSVSYFYCKSASVDLTNEADF